MIQCKACIYYDRTRSQKPHKVGGYFVSEFVHAECQLSLRRECVLATLASIVGRSENHKNELRICPECYYYVLVYHKTGFEEKN